MEQSYFVIHVRLQDRQPVTLWYDLPSVRKVLGAIVQGSDGTPGEYTISHDNETVAIARVDSEGLLSADVLESVTYSIDAKKISRRVASYVCNASGQWERVNEDRYTVTDVQLASVK